MALSCVPECQVSHSASVPIDRGVRQPIDLRVSAESVHRWSR